MKLFLDFPQQFEHELLRAGMQCIVGIRQKHPQGMQENYAKNLEDLLVKHIGVGPSNFQPATGDE